MAGGTAEVRKLRGELESRFGRAILPAGGPREERGSGFRSGVGALDRLLPGGVPRGALTLWTGERTAGRTAVLRALVVRACAEGARVAVVDAGRTLDASFACTAEGPLVGVWVVRPPDDAAAASATWAAESLLRAGVFDLVVLDGRLPAAFEAQRLRALARERDAALLVSAELPSRRGGATRAPRGLGAGGSPRTSDGILRFARDPAEALGTVGKSAESGKAGNVGGRSENSGVLHAGPPAVARAAEGLEGFVRRPGFRVARELGTTASAATRVQETRRAPRGGTETGNAAIRSARHPASLAPAFRPDVRLDFRRGEARGRWGLRRGGRFHRSARLSLERTLAGAPANGSREMELVHEPANRLCTGPPPPDRTPGGR